MSKKVKVALIQASARPEIEENLKLIDAAVDEAAKGGAEFVLTPENSCHLLHQQAGKHYTAKPESGHPFLEHFLPKAKALGIWLLIGSITIKEGDGKLINRSYLISPKGEIAARYDKIHLFDVDTPDGKSYRESENFEAGEQASLVHTSIGRIGLTICYDVRFPHLYRDMAKLGADIITVPAAFTVPTGKAHWKTLLRARAIENGVFILAPAQTGTHDGGRETWGHSLIIGPWGEVIAEADGEEGIITAELDLAEVEACRTNVPSLKNERPYVIDELGEL